MPETMTVRLDEQLCFALYAASNAVVRAYRPLLREIGLTYPQYLAMMVIWQDDGRSIVEIAARLQLPGNALTPMLDRLERLGWVTRTRSTTDARVVLVHLTAEGRSLEHSAALVQRRVVCRTGLGDGDLADLRSSLRDLTDHMCATATCADPPEGCAP